MLAHHLRKGPRLGAGGDLFAGPLLGMLRDGRVGRLAEEDLLLLDAVADDGAPVNAHVESADAEGDQDDPCG